MFPGQESIPAHLVTSPIPTEDPGFWGRDSRVLGSGVEGGPAEEGTGTSGVKKRRKRRKKPKVDPRKEETTADTNSEAEMDKDKGSEDDNHIHPSR